MSIINRIRRIETVMQDSQGPEDAAHLNYFLGVCEIVYTVTDEAEQQRQIAALGPKPPAVTDAARAFERALQQAYGEN